MFICLFNIFCEFVISTDVSDVLLKHPPHFHIAGKFASANGDVTSAASLRTTYERNFGDGCISKRNIRI